MEGFPGACDLFGGTSLDDLFHELLLTFGTAMVPVLELRGAIPVGVAAGLHPIVACVVAIIGNPLMYFVSLLVGSVVGCLILSFLKKPLSPEESGLA